MLDRPLTVDANILFAGLLRDGTTRHILLYEELDLRTPATIWRELERNRTLLLEKARSTEAAFALLLELVREHVREVPFALLAPHWDEAKRRVGPDGLADAPYVAAALALDGILWTHDKRLVEVAGVPVVTTAEVVEVLEG